MRGLFGERYANKRLVQNDRAGRFSKDLIDKLADCHPSLQRGQVWCTECGKTQKVDSATCIANGWPKCCGYTMTIDSPDERERLEASAR